MEDAESHARLPKKGIVSLLFKWTGTREFSRPHQHGADRVLSAALPESCTMIFVSTGTLAYTSKPRLTRTWMGTGDQLGEVNFVRIVV